MKLSNVVNEFLNQDGFTNSSATEESNLTTASDRTDQVDDLDARFEYFDST